MTLAVLRETVAQAPSWPLRLQMSSGRIVEVKHHDYISFGPPGVRLAVVYYDNGGAAFIDPLHIESIGATPASQSAS